MVTRFTSYCDRVIEGGWLAALIVAPLFFNIYSSRVFEPDKASLIRTIALVMAGAWLLKLLDRDWLRQEAQGQGSESRNLRSWLQVPLVLPTILLAGTYLISTTLSLAPSLSFWGSYERMQGAYTTLSYLVVFASILALLRRREQLERLMYAAIIASLPVTFYGLLQRNGLDTLPWLGDVSTRVAGSLGNAIFLGAYLIIAFFLTLYQALTALMRLVGESWGRRAALWAVLGIAGGGLGLLGWAISLQLGMALFLLFPLLAAGVAYATGAPLRTALGFSVTAPLAGMQALCIYYTGSRGPWLGFVAGLFLFCFLGLILLGRWATRSPQLPNLLRQALRWAWLVPLLFGLAFMLFVVSLNMPGSPLAPLRELPGVGRLGSITQLEEGTNKVRVLIWEGALQLITPHAPLEYPDGRVDRLNPIRPLLGYGPEAMWVAYNRFYPPDLAHYEARNASPDRSHNETLDALAMTGLLGFLAYMALFLSAFYHAFRWLGLSGARSDLAKFLAFSIGSAVVFVLGAWRADGSLRLAGVALPVGLIGGVILYTIWRSLRPSADAPHALTGQNLLLVLALLSAIAAHFIEIHFGIAIVATRLYFWVAIALLVLVGTGRIQATGSEATAAIPAPAASEIGSSGSRRRRRPRPSAKAGERPKKGGAPVHQAPVHPWQSMRGLLPASLLLGVVLVTLGYDFITNQAQIGDTLMIFWRALTTRIASGQVVPSHGILWMWLATWVGGMLLAMDQSGASNPADPTTWTSRLTVFSSTAWGGALLFGLLQSARLRPGGGDVTGVFAMYAIAIILAILLLALTLIFDQGEVTGKQQGGSSLASVAVPGVAVVVLMLAWATNIRPVRADIYYKQALSAEGSGWDASIALHRKAIELAPNEDRYYLFLGRAELEKARSISDPQERERTLQSALEVLTRARELSPLNTDHTANLARLYRSWADFSDNDETRRARLEQSSEYYRQATILSPHNAGLFNEWGIVYSMLGKPEEALARYQRSLELDSKFAQTYLLIGDLHLNRQEYEQALEAYAQALAIDPNLPQAHSARGYIYSQMGRVAEAITENLETLRLSPDDFATYKNLVLLYNQAGQPEKALEAAEQALQRAPENEKAGLQTIITQLRQSAGLPLAATPNVQELLAQGQALFNQQKWDEAAAIYEKVLELNPDEIQAHMALGYIAFQRGDLAAAERHNLRLLELNPNDYNTHKNLAIVYQQMGEPQKALIQAEAALALAPPEEQEALRAFIAALRQAAGG